MIGDLTGKRTLVTGAARGIGRAVADVMLEQGARVVGGDIEEIPGGEQQRSDSQGMLAVKMDVASEEAVRRAVNAACRELGSIDVLVNVAGVAPNAGLEHDDEPFAHWDATFEINVKGVVRCCCAVLPLMRRQQGGRIINVASVAGHASYGRSGYRVRAYDASKAAVLRYTKGLAIAEAGAGINVNAVCPGAVWTPPAEDYYGRLVKSSREYRGLMPYEAFRRDQVKLIPLGRPQEARDIAVAVAFLASEDARNITGQCLHVDGGIIIE
jgi:NAD(P)-dependent dehydrogenase (short-subunit alcohol dehydrogenase family)